MKSLEDMTKEELIEVVQVKNEMIANLENEIEIFKELADSLVKKPDINEQM